MEFLKKHADAAAVIGILLTAMIWMHSAFKDVNSEFKVVRNEFAGLNAHINQLDLRLTRIETVMIMQKFMPTELARREKIVDCENG